MRAGQRWIQQSRLTARDGVAGDWFGHAVALSGTTVLVGAWYAHGQAGAVYVFTLAAGSWSEQGRLTAGDGAGQAYFGGSVAEAGSTGLVGAGFQDHARGAVYIFAGVPAA